MPHANKTLSSLLSALDLGSSVAELDTLLETARIETSAFADLLADRVDLIPGTKGSGKSALFRIFVDFLPDVLLQQDKVVVAHGIEAPGDPVFQAFSASFAKLSEDEFVSFWCIYLVSLAHEHFVKGSRYSHLVQKAKPEIEIFKRACAGAGIPEIQARKSLKEILQWSLNVLASWRPKLKLQAPNEMGEVELDLFGSIRDIHVAENEKASAADLPRYANDVKDALEALLVKSGVSLWLMVDRLDEIFPRRSSLERTALRGILRAIRYFSSSTIRVKVFLRDDMLEQVVREGDGFTALTHVTARRADTIRWAEDQVLAMVVKRFYANSSFANYLKVKEDTLEASATYRRQAFLKIFPKTVFRGDKQSSTIRWIYNRCADGRGVVTPRDVLDLLLRAKQRQQDLYLADPDGVSDTIIGAMAIRYGFEELSKRKRETYLQAEFPHFWAEIEKFVGGKTSYDTVALQTTLGKDWRNTIDNLIAIGFFAKGKKAGQDVFSIPPLFRHGIGLTQGKA